jgi:ABC-2 type transport system permease protein
VTVALRFIRDRRRTILYWILGIGVFVFFTIAFYPAIKDQPTFDDAFKDASPSVKELIGAAQGLTTPVGYLHSQFFSSMLPILLLVFGIGVGARAIAGAEDDGTLELLLANPVTRRRVAVERYLSAIAQVVIVGVVAGALIVGLSGPFGLLESVSKPALVGACLAVTCLGILYASLAFAWGAARGGRGSSLAISASFAVGGFVIYGLVRAGVVPFLRFFTPWWWYLSRNIVAFGLQPEAVLVPLALSAVLAFVGVWGFERRDLQSS